MSDCLRGLVETIIRSLPVEDPHAQQRQQRSIIDLCPIDHTKPFSPMDHMGPQPIVEIKVWEDIIPPMMVCSRLVLPFIADPMEGVLGDLQIFLFSISTSRNKEGSYLMCHQVMSPPRCQGMYPIVKTFDLPKEPTYG